VGIIRTSFDTVFEGVSFHIDSSMRRSAQIDRRKLRCGQSHHGLHCMQCHAMLEYMFERAELEFVPVERAPVEWALAELVAQMAELRISYRCVDTMIVFLHCCIDLYISYSVRKYRNILASRSRVLDFRMDS